MTDAPKKPRYWKNPRPTGNRTGKPRNIYLDDETFETAKRLGDGSASLGIKRALSTAKSS